MKEIEIAQTYLKENEIDAWILSDYENRNPAVVRFLGKRMLTRKLFVVIPSREKPYIICHIIDTVFLRDEAISSLFDLRVYKTWQEMLDLEKKSFSCYKKVCVDISENGLLPRVSLADYGTVSFIKNLVPEVVSSGNVLERITATLSDRSKALQRIANQKVLDIKDEAFSYIAKCVRKTGTADEYDVQQFICRRFKEEGLTYDEPPIVAIGPNASDPHYTPDEKTHSSIHEGDLILIDMWAMVDDPDGVYSDITWMGYVGTEIPEIYAKRFSILKNDVDLCVKFLEDNIGKRVIHGYEVDDVSRQYINEQGYGEYYTHRVGHSIAVDVSPHGSGANMDNYETHDDREILNDLCFSLEPGIYAPDFGMRSETNVLIDDGKPVVVAGRQETIIPILLLK